MEIKLEVDLTPVRRVMERFPEIAKVGIRKPLLSWVGSVSRQMATRLSGTGSGLNRRTGRTLLGNLLTGVETQALKSDAAGFGFQTIVGFMDPHAARIARVHELGTVGKGGTLPDITPKRFKFLWIPVTNLVKKYDAPLLAWAQANGWVTGKASRKRGKRKSTKPKRGGKQFILLRKASIPPRLGFRRIQEAAIRNDLPVVIAAIPATIAKEMVKAAGAAST